MARIKHADIILIYPKTGIDFGSTIAPPHSLLSIAAPLHKEGYSVAIIDQRVNKNWRTDLAEYLESKPICVGISTMTGTQIYHALEAGKEVRSLTNGKVPIVWGGAHPSILPEQALENENVDIVCVGEGDVTFYELVRVLESRSALTGIEGIAYKNGRKIINNPPRRLVDVESLLPVPWGLIDVEAYIHPDMYLKKSLRTLDIGQTSRGCPFDCGFCSSASLRQRKWRAMSVERSLQTIVESVKRFKLDGIWIRDDEFYIDRKRANQICESMIHLGLNVSWYTSGTRIDVFNKATENEVKILKRSGAYVLKFGAESGSNRILKLINKGITVEQTIEANLKIKRHGIIPVYALMVGFPSETFEEINSTIDLTFRLKKDNPLAKFESICNYTALPATPMYELALNSGLKPPDKLTGWINWLFDGYDVEGKKISWFNYQDRIRLGNISQMSVLANALGNLFDSIDNKFIRKIVKLVYAPIGWFYQQRLKHKWYTFYFDLAVIDYLRKKIFYRHGKTL